MQLLHTNCSVGSRSWEKKYYIHSLTFRVHLLKKAFVKNSFSVEEEPQFDSRPNQISSCIIYYVYLVQRNFTFGKSKKKNIEMHMVVKLCK